MNEYEVFQDVTITAIDTDGFIDRIETSSSGVQYRVVYWFNGERRETWLYGREIERR